MKTYVLLFFVISGLSFASCKKNKCQTCTTRVTQNVQGVSVEISVEDQDYCGDSYDDAPAETSVNQNVQGVTQTVTISCEDK